MSDTKGAIFLDRDNTIAADPGYLNKPADVTLMPDAAAGIAAMQQGGWPIVVVSNQSGMALGLHGIPEYEAVNRRKDSEKSFTFHGCSNYTGATYPTGNAGIYA